MSTHHLRLSVGPRQLEALPVNDFLWRPRGEKSSFQTPLSPRLEELGRVPPLHVDLVRFAVLVFMADRSRPRERGTGLRWDRRFDLHVPVSDPRAWTAVGDELGHMLHVLSGDEWQLTFHKARAPRRAVEQVKPVPVVCLFSGGADSLAGALAAHRDTGEVPVLVSHWDAGAISGVQNEMTAALAHVWGERPEHHRLQVQRRTHQVGSDWKFPEEKSRRTRSLLFLALGLASAAARDAELRMSENGFTTINPPLAPERRGSLTTRTTHPGFLEGLTQVLTSAGLTVRLSNPLAEMTKGEVLTQAARDLPAGTADQLFSQTHSCGKTPWFKGFSQGAQCGLCYGCLVRRGSFIASGLEDQTEYVEAALRGKRRRADFVTATRRSTIEAVRYRLRRGYSIEDLLPLGLPEHVSLDDTLDLVNRGLDELRPVVQDIP